MVCICLLPLAGGAARFAVAVGAVLSVATYASPYGVVLARERTFFGVHMVVEHRGVHRLLHGTTLHGVQVAPDVTEPALARLRTIPGTYYHRSGPIGDVIRELGTQGRFRRAGFVGLGAGTMDATIRTDYLSTTDLHRLTAAGVALPGGIVSSVGVSVSGRALTAGQEVTISLVHARAILSNR